MLCREIRKRAIVNKHINDLNYIFVSWEVSVNKSLRAQKIVSCSDKSEGLHTKELHWKEALCGGWSIYHPVRNGSSEAMTCTFPHQQEAAGSLRYIRLLQTYLSFFQDMKPLPFPLNMGWAYDCFWNRGSNVLKLVSSGTEKAWPLLTLLFGAQKLTM